MAGKTKRLAILYGILSLMMLIGLAVAVSRIKPVQ